MPPPRFSSKEISEVGRQIYEQRIRRQVETEATIGKLISIDIETGDYEISNDQLLDAPRRLLAKHQDASIITFLSW